MLSMAFRNMVQPRSPSVGVIVQSETAQAAVTIHTQDSVYTQLRAGVPPWLILFPCNISVSFGNHSSKGKRHDRINEII